MIKTIVLEVIILLPLLVGCMDKRQIEIPDNISSLPNITSYELYKSYIENEIGTNKKFHKKPFILISKPTSIEEGSYDYSGLINERLGKEASLRAKLYEIDTTNASKLKVGREVKLFCNNIDMTFSSLYVDCRILKN